MDDVGMEHITQLGISRFMGLTGILMLLWQWNLGACSSVGETITA
jgi:hypothetical protein